MGPGWGSAGDTDVNAVGTLGALNIASLRAAGYNVLTWDPRGFGASTGTAEIDSPDFEGRDVEQLLDWVATMPGVELDAKNDPRVGMVGGSYGGGIQLVTAALDCRIDALVPVIAWHSLTTSLFKADTPKQGWATFLNVLSAGKSVDPTVARSNAAIASTASIDAADLAWFAARGPGEAVSRISVPTLLIQGIVDTLFTLDEAVTNYQVFEKNGVPTAMLWFCGGHGVCLTKPGDTTRVSMSAIAWLDRYVKRDQAATAVPAFETVDQNGITYTARVFPPPAGNPLEANGKGTLSLVTEGGAGPATSSGGGALGRFVGLITPAKATNAVNVPIALAAAPSLLVGAPQLTFAYSGTTPPGQRPTRVFAQLIDDTTGLVIGNQITPIEVALDGQPHTATVLLEMISFDALPGSTVTLQIVASTVAYAAPRTGGTVTFSSIDISLPTVTGMTPAAS